MKNYTMVFSWPRDLWVDICPACLEKYLQGKTLAEMGILQIRQSPCKCDYCGALGGKEDWYKQR